LNEATALVDVMGLLYEADYRQQLIEEVATGLILESIKKKGNKMFSTTLMLPRSKTISTVPVVSNSYLKASKEVRRS